MNLIHFVGLVLIAIINYVNSRDFYVGMFKKNDFLVAQDRLYRQRVPYRQTVAMYGRKFRCPITYFRVVDRLGVGRGPNVQITRGGLQKRFLTLRVTSVYNYPLSVNIYVGCENKVKPTQKTTTTTTTTTTTSTTPSTTLRTAPVTTKAESSATSALTTVANLTTPAGNKTENVTSPAPQ